MENGFICKKGAKFKEEDEVVKILYLVRQGRQKYYKIETGYYWCDEHKAWHLTSQKQLEEKKVVVGYKLVRREREKFLFRFYNSNGETVFYDDGSILLGELE